MYVVLVTCSQFNNEFCYRSHIFYDINSNKICFAWRLVKKNETEATENGFQIEWFVNDVI